MEDGVKIWGLHLHSHLDLRRERRGEVRLIQIRGLKDSDLAWLGLLGLLGYACELC